MNETKIIYLDNAATTEPDLRVINKMMHALRDKYGNPNSSHIVGAEAKDLIEEARCNIAEMINCSPECVIFTSGGTESNNWAIYSSIVSTQIRSIVSSEIEHHSIHNGIGKFSRSLGAKPFYIRVDSNGVIDIERYSDKVHSRIGLVSIMMANNEIGTIQPIKELARLAHERGTLFHTDAVQGAGKIKIDVKDLDVDMLSLSGHKFHGPKGVGILYVKPGIKVYPMIAGGHQENGYRAGTYNVPGIVGMGEAARLINSQETMDEIKSIGELLWNEIKSSIPNVKRNGNSELSVPGIVNICFRGIESKSVVLELSKKGICCSSGSACNEGETSPSHVLKAIGKSTFDAHSSIRFSLSRNTTKEDVYESVNIIKEVVNKHREMI